MTSAWSEFHSTFSASTRSVGTAVTLAAVGVYLHRRELVSSEGKRTLAKISQQVTFPLFLGTKIVYCNQNWSDEPCPDVTKSLRDVWMLTFWPAVVVGIGLLVGWGAALVSGTPKSQFRSVLAACAFGNSTGLPITLLTVVNANFPETSDLGHIDPTLFLSVYLLLYPVLQWGVGGWLLAPDETESLESTNNNEILKMGNTENGQSAADTENETKNIHNMITLSPVDNLKHVTDILSEKLGHSKNVLNNKEKELWYKHSRNAMAETDASLYISDADLAGFGARYGATQERVILPQLPFQPDADASNAYQHRGHCATPLSPIADETETAEFIDIDEDGDVSPLFLPPNHSELMEAGNMKSKRQGSEGRNSTATSVYEGETLCETCSKVMSRCFQPPVIGALVGIFVAATPLRGIFVDIVDRGSHAPLQWFFDGLYAVGLAAVPINMIILGCNLSASADAYSGGRHSALKPHEESPILLSQNTMVAIVMAKMLVMPIIGILLAFFLKQYVLHIPSDIDGSFYLVLMIVFITPTANNVMVMVELSGSNTKEGIAQVIALQYACAPLMLSLTMSLVVAIASRYGND